jgi:hypothetical protein
MLLLLEDVFTAVMRFLMCGCQTVSGAVRFRYEEL